MLDKINKKIQEYDKQLFMEQVQGASLQEGMNGVWSMGSAYALYRTGSMMIHKLKEFPAGVNPEKVMEWLRKNDNHRGINTIKEINNHNDAVTRAADKKVEDSIDMAASDIIRAETTFTKLMK